MPTGIYDHQNTKTPIYTQARLEKIRKANTGKTHTLETRQKLQSINKGRHHSLATEFKKGQRSWNTGVKQLKTTDEKHPQWRGDEVGYYALHSWVRRKIGVPALCSRQDETCKGMFEWCNLDGEYTRNLDTWGSMCRSHHRTYDNALMKIKDIVKEYVDEK